MSDRLKIAVLLTPALGVIGVLFFGGLGIGLLRSFSYMPVIGLTDPNLDAYRAVLAAPGFGRSLVLSLYIALTSTLIASVLGLGAALLLRRSFAGRGVARFLFQLNLTIPHIVGAIGILYLLSQSGSFARIAAASGLIDRPAQFPALIFDPAAIGIILHYVWKEVPFFGLILLANMQALGTDYETVARTLGASRWQSLRHVLLPQLQPALTRAAVIVFAFSFGAYEVPALLGANAPAALPVLAWRQFSNPDLATRPQAMAMAMIIALISALLIGLYLWLLRGRR